MAKRVKKRMLEGDADTIWQNNFKFNLNMVFYYLIL